jgi:hypothetical protein
MLTTLRARAVHANVRSLNVLVMGSVNDTLAKQIVAAHDSTRILDVPDLAGKKLSAVGDGVHFIPDETVAGIVATELQDSVHEHTLLDGFPVSVAQARALAEHGAPVHVILHVGAAGGSEGGGDEATHGGHANLVAALARHYAQPRNGSVYRRFDNTDSALGFLHGHLEEPEFGDVEEAEAHFGKLTFSAEHRDWTDGDGRVRFVEPR